ncbi:MAG: bifunctional riboflavin kinase/FAD synthetase [Paracoccaceae bacterium]
MRIFNGLDELPEDARGASAAIGNFDGVHLGHQRLIQHAARHGGTAQNPVAVVTFEPHPRRLFQPDAPPFCLTLPAEKARILAKHGTDLLINLPFDRAMAGMAAQDFVSGILHTYLGLSHVVVGSDFRFGKARKGDAALLREMGANLEFGVTVEELIGDETGEYASTAVRAMVTEGQCEDAARQLGRWHTVSGTVIQGDQRGRDLGYPTANLAFGAQLTPRYGVYATWVDVLGGPHKGRHPGVASLGERPTFGVNAPNFEVHLFDFSGDLYGVEISVGLVRYLRDEVAFVDVPTLIAQMDRDSDDAKAILASAVLPE